MDRNPLRPALRRVLIACLFVVAAVAALPSAANAAGCNGNLLDSFGANWDYQSSGEIGDGSIDRGNRDDAYDVFPGVALSTDAGATWLKYHNPDSSACTDEASGREIVYPSDTTTAPGLVIDRKIYVPGSGLAFARFLTFLTNTSGSPITVDLDIGGGKAGYNLGSDSDTLVSDSSSGDSNTALGDTSAMTAADNWATTWDGATDINGVSDSDPPIAHDWQFDGDHTGLDSADDVGSGSTPDKLFFDFQNITIAAGQTVGYMNFEALRATTEQSSEIARALGAMPFEAVADLSPAEEDAIRNWPTADVDFDGVPNSKDNCATIANADQTDTDGDGKGDVCDSDIDGDGLSNASEAEFGTDPNKPDTDGDGVNDKADACPRTAGAGSDGCPVAQQAGAPAPTPDRTPPNARITSVTSGNTVADLLNGINVTFSCDEPCQADARELARIPAGQAFLSAATGFNQVLGRKHAPFGAGSRTIRVRPCEPKPGAAQSKACLNRLRKAASRKSAFLVKVYLTAEDKSGNTKQASKVIRVRR